jgi:hypothetical protein
MREGEKAMAEYKAAQQAIREKTARLRALRLARDAAKKEQALRRSAQPLQRSPRAGSVPLTSQAATQLCDDVASHMPVRTGCPRAELEIVDYLAVCHAAFPPQTAKCWPGFCHKPRNQNLCGEIRLKRVCARY